MAGRLFGCPDSPFPPHNHRWFCRVWGSRTDQCFHCGIERLCQHRAGSGRLLRDLLDTEEGKEDRMGFPQSKARSLT